MIQRIITPDNFKKLPVNALFTTKSFHEQMNDLGDELHAEAVYLPIQKHTDKVIVAEYDLEPKVADAVVTSRKGLVIGIKVADCVPILLFDKRKYIVGAVHAGWRGTADGILKKTLSLLEDKLNSCPSDVIVAIGPSIRGCCYVVGPEVVDAVTRETGKGDYVLSRGRGWLVDLAAANRQQAISSGIAQENIWMSSDCTHCLPDKYYSYRYCKGVLGRQYGLIMMPQDRDHL